MSQTVSEGALIDGRYRIVSKIADGGMASVYKAVDERLGRNVAIKIMHMQLAQGPHRDEFVERFHREVITAAAIANPHIVQVYDTGEYEGLDYLVMEYVHGVNLRKTMTDQATFSVKETLRIIGETLNGLASAHHANVVHRDIKPENILINDRGRIQITDFGLAKVASQATLSSTGMLLGTAAYLAPEMIENNQSTPQGDCYSVGIMAWEMLTGQVPFQSDNPVTLVFKHVNDDVPPVASICSGIAPSVSSFISFLTARSLESRPASAQEALERLRALMAQLTPEELAYRYIPGSETTDTTRLPLKNNEPRVVQAGPQPSNQETVAFPAPETPELPETQGEPHTQDTPVPDHNNNHDQVHPTTKQKSRKPLIITLIIGLIVALAAAGFALWYYIGPGSYWTMPKPDDLTCNQEQCKIANISWKSYERTLKVSNIPYSVTQTYSDTVAKGDVISTNPATVGAHVSKRNNETVLVTVSQGIKQATIPADILDVNAAAGKDPIKALTDAGFTNIVHDDAQDQWSIINPAGSAISVDPQPGTTLNHNAPVTVILSKGPKPVSMPNIVGKNHQEAQQALDEEKLSATYSEEFSDTIEKGIVISTSQAAGTELHWGDSVNVVLSKGPQMVTIPDVTGMKYDEAKKKLEDLGLEVRMSAPLGDLLHTVRMQSPKAGEEVRLRSTDGKKTVVTLTVI